MCVRPLSEQTFALWVFEKKREKGTEDLLRSPLALTKRHTVWAYILDRLSEVRGRAGETSCSVKRLLNKHGNLNLTPAPHKKPGMGTLTYNPSTGWRQVVTGGFWEFSGQPVWFNCKLNTIESVSKEGHHLASTQMYTHMHACTHICTCIL